MKEYARHITQITKPTRYGMGRLDIELTERCDNDCIHCSINLSAGDNAARVREMTTEQVCEILRQTVDLGCLQVRFTGGEPLLRPDFEELYLFARHLGLTVIIFTNARRITEHLADVLARIPPRRPIEVTVYGMHRESYEAVTRVPGSFFQFRRGIALLLERRVPFAVKGAFLPPNCHELGELDAWAGTIPGMETPVGCSLFFDLRGRRDDAVKNRLIESIRPTPEQAVAVLTRDEAGYRLAMADFAAKFMGPSGDRLFACGAGRAISVDAYGRAQPCLGLRVPGLTVDVLASSLAEALERFGALGEMRATNPEYLRRCSVCPLRGLCELCPAKSWAEHGTLDQPVEYLCAATHAQARLLGWLEEDEDAWDVTDWPSRIQSRRVERPAEAVAREPDYG